MKAFVISLIVLFSFVALTIINAIYINNVTADFIEKAQGLGVGDCSVEDFIKGWEKHEPFIKISTSHKETHRIDEVLSVLERKSKNHTRNGFDEERALLIEYLTQIKEDETVSLDSII